jgi:trans-aconitate methyltransferase
MYDDPMQINDANITRLCPHGEVYERLLPLSGARILELGCGKAEVTRAIAQSVPSATITALEVDRTAHSTS